MSLLSLVSLVEDSLAAQNIPRNPNLDPMTTPTHSATPAATTATAEEATAYVMGRALGLPPKSEGEALAVLRQRVEALHDPTSPAALDELRRHLPVLETLWQRFAVESLNAKKADDRARLLRVALQAQQAHARTLALLRALSAPAAPRLPDADTEGT